MNSIQPANGPYCIDSARATIGAAEQPEDGGADGQADAFNTKNIPNWRRIAWTAKSGYVQIAIPQEVVDGGQRE